MDWISCTCWRTSGAFLGHIFWFSFIQKMWIYALQDRSVMWTYKQCIRAMMKFASNNMLLIHTETLMHWHSIPPHTQSSCQTSPNSLSWLYTWLTFPLPLQVFLTPFPTQIPYLISVFSSSFPWLSVSVRPVLHPPPTFSHLPFLHCMNKQQIFLFSSSHLSLSSCDLITPSHRSEAQEIRSSPQNLFWMPECGIGGITEFTTWHLVHTAAKQKAREASRKNFLFLKSNTLMYFKEAAHMQSVCSQDLQQAREHLKA